MSEFIINVDSVNLAQQYASFLVGLGGVSITVLTLVLALQQVNARRYYHSHIVASLVVATIACFIGAHLMAETAAIVISTPKDCVNIPIDLPEISYSFLLASISVYVAAMLFMFALMLLPTAYETKKANDLSREITPIGECGFLFVTFGALYWMIQTYGYTVYESKTLELSDWNGSYHFLTAAVILLAVSVIKLSVTYPRTRKLHPLPYTILVLFLGVSLVLFASGYAKPIVNKSLKLIYLEFFRLSITFSACALIGLWLKIMKRVPGSIVWWGKWMIARRLKYFPQRIRTH